MAKFSAPKGTHDVLPPESLDWLSVERTFADVCALYGYQPIRVPTFEQTELFSRGVGETTDVVEKEMYTFEDRGGRSMTLRPEGTAGVVRSYLENGMSSLPAPVRLFYTVTAFRYENVQKGRYREFSQFGCEAIGSAGPQVDGELIELLLRFLTKVGIGRIRLCLNSIGCPVCRPPYLELLRNHLSSRRERLCRHCQNRFERNLLRVIDCKEPGCQAATADIPLQIDHLCTDCDQHFQSLQQLLAAMGIAFEIDPRIVRGLDYYTRTVFEIISENVGTQGTICGGGRYDRLAEILGGPPTPGVGFALGVERLQLERRAQGLPAAAPVRPLIFLAVAGDHSALAMRLCRLLRDRGIATETDLMNRSLKAQMKQASRSGAAYALVIGDDEAAAGSGRLRDLASGEERDVVLDDLAEELGRLDQQTGGNGHG